MKVVELTGICKNFGDIRANKNIFFDLEKGEVHALLGENGAGKTTLMNILYGLYKCDEGDIYINGEKVEIDNPKTAISCGIGMVHQHFMLVPQMTVTQNIFLGMKESGFLLNLKKLNTQVAEINDRFGFNVSPEACIWQLPVGVQQKVEILKALIRKAKILILDEPTAVLTPQEVEDFFRSVKKLTREGYSVILITHKMEEVIKNCDRVTVMREGEVIDTVRVSDTDHNALAKMMVGRNVSLERNMPEIEQGETMFTVDKLNVLDNRGLPAVRNLSLEIKGGEILAIAGVDGNGQLELGEAIVGLRKIENGTLSICGRTRRNPTPAQMLASRLAHIPDDRQKKGLVLQFPIKENLIMGSQRAPRHHDGPLLNYERIEKEARDLMESFDVRPRKTDLPAGNLSGGNQQKVILARELSRNPEVLVAIQPTRGLDIGAIEFVRKKIVEERNKGKAVLLISTDMDEILTMGDRIAVMYKGQILDTLSPDVPIEEIGLLMGGIQKGNTDAEI